MSNPYMDSGDALRGERELAARREWRERRAAFAAAALIGVMSDSELMEMTDHDGIARAAWRYADAMMAAEPETQP